MRIRIISNGNPLTTKVIDAQTGEPLEGVIKVEWEITPAGAIAKLHLASAEMDVTADDPVMVEPGVLMVVPAGHQFVAQAGLGV